ncbi:hypothetical protein COY33_00710 [candidate division WWE3 bacterium CG_4_10_14_0_2_um_filter_42_7]|uniref:SpoVT-AbrB domain-containing protein n=2 Tax=Katanobacteria TaxID=422282 RepID=A0A2H0XAK0_UNCKA|nr:MAG: hypothetical protein COT51_00110 [candidate division WWE3 bacterium CG08_land_8_20_14_0_20_41_15]PIZ43867.1 MAG: hypothetical protein COY33_00710 [candidate division WWE3 bacterium CG_4_10_14_0_2_um_filter_42_7]
MSDRRHEDRNIRKITKIGGTSYGVTLPIEVIREFGWKEKQKVTLEINSKKKLITIRDWKD